MEAVEMIVYIGIAVLIGGVLITFLLDWDVQKTYEDVKSIVFKEHDAKVGYKKLTSLDLWQNCTMPGKTVVLECSISL